MSQTPSGISVKALHRRAVSLVLLAAVGIVGCNNGCPPEFSETAAGAEEYSKTWDRSSTGHSMKRMKIAEGISVAVPRNFPRPVERDDGTVKVISYSLKPHEGAPRFLHFFEIRASREALDADQILADFGYEIGDQEKEEITVDGRKSTLTTTPIRITLRCGSQVDATSYSWTCYCAERKTHVLIVTFTMMRDGFLDIVKSFRCPVTRDRG